MIEAVNSVLANSSLARGNAEQQSVARSFAANPERVQEIPQAPFISPYIVVDVNFDRAILQIRNGDTGEVERQIPSETQLEAYRRAQSVAAEVNVRPQPQVEQQSSVSVENIAPAPQPAQPADSGTQEVTAPVSTEA